MTLFGWDASDYDWGRGPMDLGAAARDGITFFTHKATEATNVKHTHFGEAMRRARDAGIPFLGAYHVVRSPRDAANEVDYFLNYIDQQFPEWRAHPGYFFQPDLEKWQYDSVPAAEGEDFADIAEVQGKKVAIIYASKGQYGNDLAGTSHELWNANYPLNYQSGSYRDLYARAGGDSGAGWASYSGRVPKIWQYTSSAVIGSQNTCDANAFRGTVEEFRAMIRGGDTFMAALTDDEQRELLAKVRSIVGGWPATVVSEGQPDGRPVSVHVADLWRYLVDGKGAYATGRADPSGPPSGWYLDDLLKQIRDARLTGGAPTQAMHDASVLKAMQDPAVQKGIGDAIAAHLKVT